MSGSFPHHHHQHQHRHRHRSPPHPTDGAHKDGYPSPGSNNANTAYTDSASISFFTSSVGLSHAEDGSWYNNTALASVTSASPGGCNQPAPASLSGFRVPTAVLEDTEVDLQERSPLITLLSLETSTDTSGTSQPRHTNNIFSCLSSLNPPSTTRGQQQPAAHLPVALQRELSASDSLCMSAATASLSHRHHSSCLSMELRLTAAAAARTERRAERYMPPVSRRCNAAALAAVAELAARWNPKATL